MADDAPSPPPVPISGKQSPVSRLSPVWFIPLLAIAVAAWVAWDNWSKQGPVIEVALAEADGLHAGETELRYRDISVGLVEELRFSEDLANVIATIRLDKEIAPFVDADAQFWIVRPEVTAQGVSGLDTVLSGVYLAGAWDSERAEPQTRFTALAAQPLLALGENGTTFTLQSEVELPLAGTPILYRGVRVGRIGPSKLDAGGLTASASAVIFEPHETLITSATRFWDISGVDFSLGAQGASLDFDSLASLVTGGVTFETLASGGDPLDADKVFELHPNEEIAREDFFVNDTGGTLDVLAIFEENLPGLQAGAAVTLGGLRLGEVLALSGIVDRAQFGDSQARLVATLRLSPARLGLEGNVDESAFLAFLDTRVRDGLRARLATGSILTGGLKVELVDVPNAPPATLDQVSEPFPVMPTTAARVTDVTASAQGVLARIEALPIEDVLNEAIGLIGDVRSVIGGADVQRAPASLIATLEAVQAVATSPEVAGLPAQVGEVADQLSTASKQLNAVLSEVEDQAIIAQVSQLIERLDRTAQTLPSLSEQAFALIAQAQNLPLETAVDSFVTTTDDFRAILQNEDLAALPADLRAAMDALRMLLVDEALTGLPTDLAALTDTATSAATKVDDLLDSVDDSEIIQSASDLMASLEATAADLPKLTARADAILSQAEQLALDQVAEQLRSVLGAIDALVDQDSTRDLPRQMNQTLTTLEGTLSDLRAGGVVDNANATLAAAREAAEAISQASATLPALSNRLSAAATQANSTLSAYDRNSEFSRGLATAVRQIDAAAEAIERLARQIARNPNSLLTGR